MAAQNLISVGIDVSAFDDAKKAKVQGFIDLFDKLEKYDGKSYNPLSGDGLASFNTSITQTNALLDEMNTRLNTVGKIKINSSSVKNISTDAKQATQDVVVMNSEINKGGSGLAEIGRGATHALGVVRQLAYILPGIGMAGIFNLAFEAIEQAAGALGLFTDDTIAHNKVEMEQNKMLEDRITLYKDLAEAVKNFDNISDSGSSFNSDESIGLSDEENKKRVALLKARGSNPDFIRQQELASAQSREFTAKTNISESSDPDKKISILDKGGDEKLTTSFEEALKSKKEDAISYLQILSTSAEKVKELQKNLDELDHRKSTLGVDLTSGMHDPHILSSEIDKAKSELETEQSSYKAIKAIYDEKTGIIKEYYDSKQQVEEKNKEIEKATSDEQRNLLVETNKQNLDVVLKTNQQIKQSDLTSELEKLAATKKIYDATLAVNELNRINITGTDATEAKRYSTGGFKFTENPNITSTLTDNQKAINNQKDANKKALEDYDKSVLDIETDYFQKFIKNQKDIDVATLETQATGYQKEFEGLDKHLDKMLEAYDNYLKAKQKIVGDETTVKNMAGQKDFLSGGSLTTDEVSSNNANDAKNKRDIQAGAEQKDYEITSGYLKKELEDVKNINKDKLDAYIQEEAHELNALTDALHQKLLRWVTYKRDIKRVEKRESKNESRLTVEGDVDSVSADENLINKTSKEKSESDSRLADKASTLQSDKDNNRDTLDSQRGFDEELGRNRALNDALLDQKKQYIDDVGKLGKDELKDAKARIELYSKLSLEGIDKLLGYYKQYRDAQYQIREEQVEKAKETTDETYGYEENAITESTLSLKDKTALEIQLKEQQKEYDKQASLQERNLKRDQAQEDKKITEGKIIAQTALAIVTALDIPPPGGEAAAIERGILGAAELAVVAATPIGYEKGTPKGGTPYSGVFRTGEKNKPELILEPYKSPYLVMKDNLSFLPKGTDVIPMIDNPIFDNKPVNDGWEQTRWLAKQYAKSQKEIKNIIKPVVKFDLGRELYKAKILGNG